jgi:mannan endo-1,4-beta-mannosidase
MKFLTRYLCFLFCGLISVSAIASSAKTAETLALQSWLGKNKQRPALGAQWNGSPKSLGWDEQARVAGKSPLVFGIEYFDYGPIEKNLVARETSAKFFTEKYAQGGIVTLVDHMPNLVTGGNSWDRNGEVLDAILPGGAAHAEFVAYLDRLATFLKGLNVNGKPVPVLLRPLHEMNGAWFWWGDKVSGERLVKLWRFYHDYLVLEKSVRNVLWVWSPNIDPAASTERFMGYWPGADYVDVVGLDGYDNSVTPNITNDSFVRSFNAVSDIARKFALPVAFTEVGAKYGAQQLANFWDVDVQQAMRKEFAGACYVLIWNNEYGPREQTPAAEGFRRMIQSGQFLNLGDVRGEQIYGPGFVR